MHYNIWFDVCAFAVISVLLIIYSLRRSIKILQNTIFFCLMIAAMATVITDMQAAVMEGHNLIGVYIFNSLYILMNTLMLFLYALYILSVLNYHVSKKKIMNDLHVPMVLIFLMLIVNPYTGWLYSITPDAMYHRGKLVFILYLGYAYYAAYGIICLIRFRKHTTKEKIMMLIPFVFIIVSVSSLEYFNPSLLVQPFGYSLCLVILFFGMQNPEELYDEVTGLLNMHAFMTVTGTRISAGHAFQCIYICLCDLDVAKSALAESSQNDLIQNMVGFLRKYLQKCLVYKISEGNYCLVPDEDNKSASYEIFKEIVTRLGQPFIAGGSNVSFATTCCMFEYPSDVSTVTGMLDVMQLAAQAGKSKNMAVVSTADLDLRHMDYLKEVDEKVRTAIEERRFEVYYQPIYSTETGRYVAAEALLRMKDNRHGFISPEVFIPIAEKSGMIIDIGRFVLEEVCRMLSEEGLSRYGLHYVEVNLSVVECIQDDIALSIARVLEKYELAPSSINLEITETAADSFTRIVDNNVNRLHEAGFDFSLDDFGTGYSSINRILTLPLKIIKLDKSIVQPAFSGSDAKTLLDCSVDMVKKLGLEIVAEGVETKEQAEEIIKLGCDYIQGYYFSRPVPREVFVRMIKEGTIPEVKVRE